MIVNVIMVPLTGAGIKRVSGSNCCLRVGYMMMVQNLPILARLTLLWLGTSAHLLLPPSNPEICLCVVGFHKPSEVSASNQCAAKYKPDGAFWIGRMDSSLLHEICCMGLSLLHVICCTFGYRSSHKSRWRTRGCKEG